MRYFSIFTAVLFFLSHTLLPGECNLVTPSRFATTSILTSSQGGITTYFFSNNTIQEIVTHGVPGAPLSYNTWSFDFNFASPPPQITNVAPTSDLAGISYISPTTGGLVIRLFFQTTNGDIRSVWHMGSWMLDSTLLANVPLGAPLAAVQQIDSAGELAIMVQYTDANGHLTFRVANTDAGNWGAPLTINI